MDSTNIYSLSSILIRRREGGRLSFVLRFVNVELLRISHNSGRVGLAYVLLNKDDCSCLNDPVRDDWMIRSNEMDRSEEIQGGVFDLKNGSDSLGMGFVVPRVCIGSYDNLQHISSIPHS
jgi:hypothetical protein